MTPFGQKLRTLRERRGLRLGDMARALRLSPAYLSALEHGRRGTPKAGFVQQVAAYFNLAWEDVDELVLLAGLSDPKVRVTTAGLSPLATEIANRLARRIGELDETRLAAIKAQLVD